MFRNFFKNRKGQNTAEYALLIALVVAGIVAMQQYAQRALQARVRDASVYMAGSSNGVLNSTVQYEPYYQKSDYTVAKTDTENKRLARGTVAMDSQNDKSRLGNQTTAYDANQVLGAGAMPSGL